MQQGAVDVTRDRTLDLEVQQMLRPTGPRWPCYANMVAQLHPLCEYRKLVTRARQSFREERAWAQRLAELRQQLADAQKQYDSVKHKAWEEGRALHQHVCRQYGGEWYE